MFPSFPSELKVKANDPSLSCRLPQTPRTPSTGMNHYFDDIFARHLTNSTNSRRGSASPHPKMRRSSTSRSIGARSDFDHSLNGDEGDKVSIGNSVDTETTEREKQRKVADEHTAHYVSEQLSRVRSHQSADFDGNGDEYEAQLDGQ